MGTFHRLTCHVVFGTRFREPLIQPALRERLYEYMGGTIRGLKGHLLEIGGVEDHVHLLLAFTPNMVISDLVRDLKANSAKWLNEQQLLRGRFAWQKGYAVFTVSYSHIESVRKYIQNQVEHHRRRSFEDEYKEFLLRHGIEFEDQYLFEGEYAG